jgi:hypothetical protein
LTEHGKSLEDRASRQGGFADIGMLVKRIFRLTDEVKARRDGGPGDLCRQSPCGLRQHVLILFDHAIEVSVVATLGQAAAPERRSHVVGASARRSGCGKA